MLDMLSYIGPSVVVLIKFIIISQLYTVVASSVNNY